MKIKVQIVSCTHESKYGLDNYVHVIKKDDNVDDVIEEIKNKCDYDEGASDEYFNSNVVELVIDTDNFEEIKED